MRHVLYAFHSAGVSALSHTYNAISARRNPYINPFIMGPGRGLLEQEK